MTPDGCPCLQIVNAANQPFGQRSRRTVVHWLAFLLFAPLAVSGQATACPNGGPSVQPPVGQICGFTSQVQPASQDATFSASAFLGIPYAVPPVDELRWQSPQPRTTLPQSPFLARQFGNECPQSVRPGLKCTLGKGQSEDCLYLNVWAPADASPETKYPVMVYLHGGAFIEGTGGTKTHDLFDGTYLAATGKVIVVTFNYRLGVLGFFSLAEGLAGNNFGIQDQVQVLKWVQKNIASFGGDPANVTLFGESAGAMSVGLLTFSSQSSNLFRAALMESNPLGLPYKTTADANALGAAFSDSMGCTGKAQSQAQCMADKPACQLVAHSLEFLSSKYATLLPNFVLWGPAIDGTLLNGKQPATQGASLSMPLLLGTNQAEGILFEHLQFPFGLSPEKYAAQLSKLAGSANVARVQQAYPCSRGDCSKVLSQLLTDYIFSCANRNLAIQASAAGAKPVYAYQFNQKSRFNFWPFKACENQVCHGNELPYVFNTAEKRRLTFTAEDEALSQTMGGYWTAFGTRQNPNGGNRTAWPLFGGGNNYLTLVQPPAAAADPLAAEAHCSDLWDGIGYPAPGVSEMFQNLLRPAPDVPAEVPPELFGKTRRPA